MNTVLFDLGGVLVDWNPRYLYRPLFHGEEEAMEHFLATVCAPEWNHEMDAGKTFAVAVRERQNLFPEHADLIALWKDGWEQMLREPIDESVAILAELRARGHRLLALTNWSSETFPIARTRFPFLSWFEDIVVSGEVKLAKPDRRIFELTIQRAALDPATTVYIDDSLPNIEAARPLGFHAVHFAAPAKLRAELTRLGLI
jgi:2-haloacid dehalogenase